MPGRPTPTQEELNKIASGETVELADDGSGPDPFEVANEEARKKTTPVQTRQSQPTHVTQPRVTPKTS